MTNAQFDLLLRYIDLRVGTIIQTRDMVGHWKEKNEQESKALAVELRQALVTDQSPTR